MKIITTKFATKCADINCGATIQVGQRVKWYGRGKVYGIGCHTKDGSTNNVSYMYSPVTGNEFYQNRRGRCEDAPCCGCCNS